MEGVIKYHNQGTSQSEYCDQDGSETRPRSAALGSDVTDGMNTGLVHGTSYYKSGICRMFMVFMGWAISSSKW